MAFVRKGFLHIRNKQQIPNLESAIGALEGWFDSPMGQHLLREEQGILDEELSNLFGYHLMQLSINRQVRLYDNSRICHCFAVGTGEKTATADVGMYSSLDALPLEDESVDVTVLHHVLEFSTNPHQVLREASRVTIARGYIIIFGFNPVSLMGAIKPFAQICSSSPIWRRNSLRKARISDWLQFLDCNTLRTYNGFYKWPLQNKSYLENFSGLSPLLHKMKFPFGNFYCLVARKDRACVTPIRPSWATDIPLKVVAPKPAVSARAPARLALVRGGRSSSSKPTS